LRGVGRGSLGSSLFNNDMMFDLRAGSCLIAATGAGWGGGGGGYASWLGGGALIGGRGWAGEGLDFISRGTPTFSPKNVRPG
jgi:hypothetical protein